MKLQALFAVILSALWLSAAACSTSPTMPTPSTPPATTPAPGSAPTTPSGLNLSGTWSGGGADAQGTEQLTWTLTQTGNTLSGTADLRPADASDGSCASCHKFKSGTFTGTLSGNSVAMKFVFPSGGDGVPTPMCSVNFDLTANGASADHLTATYSGGDSCEGAVSDGSLTMARQATATVLAR